MERTLHRTPLPEEVAARNLRDCREHMLSCLGLLDRIGAHEAVHSLRLSLIDLDDCLAELEEPAELTRRRGDTIADDRRDDLMMDADRSGV